MTTIGITGGIGSGKTTVCRMLEDLGARVFYADAVAKQLMEEDPDVRAEVRAAFGEDSYTPEGKLDRAHLARTVFGDEASVARINGIVHPRVLAAFEAERERSARAGVRVLVLEAALIFESGADRLLDQVVVVEAPVSARIGRVAERDQVTPDQVHARIRHQLSPEALRRRADILIENDGTVEALRQTVEQLYRALTAAS